MNDTLIKDGALVTDGWQNVFNGINQEARIKTGDTKVGASGLGETREVMSDASINSIYLNGGIAARAIHCVADDMLRKGFNITGDSSDIIADELIRLNFASVFTEALVYGRIYGNHRTSNLAKEHHNEKGYAAYIFINVEDGASIKDPIRYNSINKIKSLRCYPRTMVYPVEGSKVTDFTHVNYGEYTQYQIIDSITANNVEVHTSRLIKIDIPHSEIYNIRKQINNSVNFDYTLGDLIQESVISKYTLTNLAEYLANGNEEKIIKRLQLISMSKSIINGVALGEGESYTRDTINFGGLASLSDCLQVLLSGVTGIPVTRLFGRSPSGLDSSGSSDLDIYYDKINGLQNGILTKPVQTLIFLINTYKKALKIESKDKKIKKVQTEDEVKITWNSLYQMTDKQKADVYFTNGQADTQYLALGVLSKEEVRKNRFVSGYKDTISVDSEKIPQEETIITETETGKDKDKEPKKEDK